MQASIIKPFLPPQGNAAATIKLINANFKQQIKKWNRGGKHHD